MVWSRRAEERKHTAVGHLLHACSTGLAEPRICVLLAYTAVVYMRVDAASGYAGTASVGVCGCGGTAPAHASLRPC
eukprot:33362-Rhodomonas_salina.5